MDNYQAILFPYAYNILGSAADAEDAIQDVILRYTAMDKTAVNNANNYLIKSVINQSIQLKKKKKLVSVEDVWLPEPIATDDLSSLIPMKDIADFSLLANLEYLKPKERAVFILKEGFDYSHEDISATLGISIENSRKLLSRSKDHLKRLGHSVKEEKYQAFSSSVKQLIQAIQDKNTKQVEKLLASEVQFTADGGKTIKVVTKNCSGITEVANLIIHVFNTYNQGHSLIFTKINHQPGIIYVQNNQVMSCQVFEIIDDKIARIDSVVDSTKLRNLEVYMQSL